MGQAADNIMTLQDQHPLALQFGEDTGRCQATQARSDDDNIILVLVRHLDPSFI